MNRAETFALLSYILRPPSNIKVFTDSIQALLGEIKGDNRTLVEAAAQYREPTSLQKEYHRLFLGPGRPIAPPFESVYLNGGQVWGASTSSFLREMRESGVEPREGFHLPPDHIAIQLEFLAFLESHVEKAQTGERQEEAMLWSGRAQSFVERHLARWLPTFLARLDAEAPTSPYTLIVREVMRLIDLDRDGISAEEK